MGLGIRAGVSVWARVRDRVMAIRDRVTTVLAEAGPIVPPLSMSA